MSGTAPVVAGLAGVVLFLVTGVALADLLPDLRALRVPLRLGVSYFLGVAFLAGGVYVASFAFHVPVGRALVFSLAGLPVAAALVQRASGAGARTREEGPADRGGPRILVLLTVVLGALVSISILADALANPVDDFDGRMTWGPPARAIALERTVLPRAIRESRWSVTRRGYPVLMPVAQAIVMTTFGEDADDRAVRPFYAAFYPAFLLVLFGGAARIAGRPAAAATTLLAALLPFLAFARNGGASGTYSDLPLGCFWGAGLLLLVAWAPRRSTALGAGLLLAAATLTKNEGAFLALSGLVAVVVFPRRANLSTRLEHAAFAAAPPFFAVVLLLAWRHEIGGTPERNYAAIVSLPALAHGALSNGAAIARSVFAELIDRRSWGFFFPAAAIVLALGARAFRRRPAQTLLLAVAGALATYLSAYVVTERPDVAPFVKDTWNRFLLQMSLPLLTLLSLTIRQALRRGSDPPVASERDTAR